MVKQRNRVTMRLISERAGVSHATVSYVLNGKGDAEGIPSRTQKHVRDVAEGMGWHPNHVLSAMNTGRTRLVGFWQVNFGAPFQSYVLRELERVVREDGHAMIVSPAYAAEGDGDYDLGLFKQWAVDGLLGMGGGEHIRAFLRRHPRWWLPIVNMGPYALTEEERVDSVSVDVLTAAREGLERWADGGRKRIAMLSGDSRPSDPRIGLYRGFVRERGLEEEIIYFEHRGQQRRSARAALERYLGERGVPEAIFCRSDETLMGAYRALRRSGCRIPEDTALLGIDGIRELEYLDHPVETVVQPVETMCREAWQLLRERMEKPERPARRVELKGELACLWDGAPDEAANLR